MGLYLAGCFTGSFITFVVMAMTFFLNGGGNQDD